jgi:hypothetical protein
LTYIYGRFLIYADMGFFYPSLSFFFFFSFLKKRKEKKKVIIILEYLSQITYGYISYTCIYIYIYSIQCREARGKAESYKELIK